MTPKQHQELIKAQISSSFNQHTPQVTDQELEQSADSFLEKGGKRAVVGEKRMFGGREYIKTMQGWKFHGKGTGVKAQEHAAGSQAVAKLEEKDSRGALEKRADEIRKDTAPKTSTSAYKLDEQKISLGGLGTFTVARKGKDKVSIMGNSAEGYKQVKGGILMPDHESKSTSDILKEYFKGVSAKRYEALVALDEKEVGRVGKSDKEIDDAIITAREKHTPKKEAVVEKEAVKVEMGEIHGNAAVLKRQANSVIKSLKGIDLESVSVRKSIAEAEADVIVVKTKAGNIYNRVFDYKGFSGRKMDVEDPRISDNVFFKDVSGRKVFGYSGAIIPSQSLDPSRKATLLKQYEKSGQLFPPSKEVSQGQEAFNASIKSKFDIDLVKYGSHTETGVRDYVEDGRIDSDGGITFGGSSPTPGKTARVTLNHSTKTATLLYGRYTSNMGSSYKSNTTTIKLDTSKSIPEQIASVMKSSKWKELQEPLDKAWGGYAKSYSDYIRRGGSLD
jgi:hypothetical protein